MTVPMQRVLAVFLEDPADERYGLEITRATGLKSGTLYPVLARLEEAGWLRSGWEDIDEREEGRRRRRYYEMTPLGQRHAASAFTELLEDLHLANVAKRLPRLRGV
jgi:PadR family transcriptional regulator PadR